MPGGEGIKEKLKKQIRFRHIFLQHQLHRIFYSKRVESFRSPINHVIKLSPMIILNLVSLTKVFFITPNLDPIL